MGIVTNVTFQLGHFLAEMDRKELELEGGDAEFAFPMENQKKSNARG